ncbi:amino acid adenylation domain-containing protein [Kitasatospora sp. NPDC093550]|uniref:amino acid adenylation domain-containing protein n=1 Tax=Kitasatospora sp. NPDC093550 TaxID=3364089 RepID=UPI0038300591
MTTATTPPPSLARGGEPVSAPGTGGGPLDWFESRLAKDPDAPAVVCGPDTWSYRQLDRNAHLITERLRGLVGPGELVGVRLDRSPLLVAAAVALARLGAVYLPLGTEPAEERLRALTEDAGIGCLLTEAGAEPPVGWDLEQPAPASADGATGGLSGLGVARRGEGPAPRRTEAFYAVTTSGSTGTPKIVLVPEAGLANLVRWTCDRLAIGPGSRVSLLIGTTFDPHLMELWAALCSGAALHIAPEEARGSTAGLFDWWREAAVTHCILPTPLADLAFSRPWPAGLALRHLSVGGDRMRVRPPADCTAAVHNMYGPAEATVLTTSHRVEAVADAAEPVPIGVPVSGVTVGVVGPDGELLPRGESGELLIGGAGLAIGYLDAARTAERFAPGPDGLGGRVYRSGDRVRMRADGVLEFLGRLDNQVKISGVRIEPAEVESALEAHPSVRRAVVVPVPGAGGAPRLAAFLRPAEGGEPAEAEVLAAARARLLPQAVPAVVRVVADFPLNANGKIDRTELAALLEREPSVGPEPSVEPPVEGEPSTEPDAVGAGPEGFVLATCRTLLDRPDLTLDANFAEAGGTSLAAARLLAAIEEEYRIRCRAAEVMRQPDLAALADLIRRRVSRG